MTKSETDHDDDDVKKISYQNDPPATKPLPKNQDPKIK